MELLGQHYFAGRSPLFSEAAAELEEQKQMVEELIWCSNEGLEFGVFGPEGPRAREELRLDLAQLRSLGHEGAKPLAEYLVHMAKAEALMMIGEDEQAFALVGGHV